MQKIYKAFHFILCLVMVLNLASAIEPTTKGYMQVPKGKLYYQTFGKDSKEVKEGAPSPCNTHFAFSVSQKNFGSYER